MRGVRGRGVGQNLGEEGGSGENGRRGREMMACAYVRIE
jgi:hypothetical protein